MTGPSIKERAAALFLQLNELGDAEKATLADEVLLLLNELRDRWIVQSTSSPRLSGKSFSILSPLIYSLESDPDQTLQNPDQKAYVMGLLQDLGSGRIVPKPKI